MPAHRPTQFVEEAFCVFSLFSADGVMRYRASTTTSDDAETIYVGRDFTGDGIYDQWDAQVTQTNGTIVRTHWNLSSTGVLLSRSFETTSANNLSWVLQWDFNGDTVTDRSASRTTVLNSDGSRTTSFTSNGINGSAVALRSSLISTISDDGFSTTYAFDGMTLAWSPSVFKRNATSSTVLNTDGSSTTTISTTNVSGVLINRLVAQVSDDGLVSSTAIDIDGNGTNEWQYLRNVATDGGITGNATVRSTSGSLLFQRTTAISSNGLSTWINFDSNGDGIFDQNYNVATASDRSLSETWWSTSVRGGLNEGLSRYVSATGLYTAINLDFNGDGANYRNVTYAVTLNVDGSTTTSTWASNARGALISSAYWIVSDDGLVVTTSVDTDGNGFADYTSTSTTTLNSDGSEATTEVSRYADSSLRSTVMSSVSANGRVRTWQSDMDGNGYDRMAVSSAVNADGSVSETTAYYSSSNALLGAVTRVTSADGLSVQRSWSNGVFETTEYLSDANGSYVWSSNQSGSVTAAHAISLAGVDTWTVNDNGVIRTVSLDLQTEQHYLSLASDLYGVMFDREMTAREGQLLIKYINGGALSISTLTTDLIASAEFAQRYGTLTNAQFVDQLYHNALARAPTLDELGFYLTRLQAGTMTRAGVGQSLAESAEYHVLGSEHAAEEITPGTQVFAREHLHDRALALNLVDHLYGVALDRAPTAAEASAYAQALVDGTWTVAQISAMLLASSEFATRNGSLTANADFVSTMFLNSLVRSPTASESSQWTSALTSGQISRADLISALAEMQDYYSYQLAFGRSSIRGTASADTLIGSGGADKILGYAGGDTLQGGAGGDVFVYRSGDGNDVINDVYSVLVESQGPETSSYVTEYHGGAASEVDVLRLTNLNADSVTLWHSGNDLYVAVTATGHSIRVVNQFSSARPYDGVERIEFANGVSWNQDAISSHALFM